MSRSRLALCAALAVVLGALLLRAAELRVAQLDRPWWEDEVHENWEILETTSLAELPRNTGWFIAPGLAFALKYGVWYRLLPVDERGLRLSSFAYSFATLAVAFALALRFARRRGYDPVASAILVVVVVGWLALQPVEVYYAAEARYYSAVSLLSVTWFGVFLLEPPGRVRRAVTSLLFANTHFFSFPLIAAAYGADAAAAARRREARGVAEPLLVAAAVLGCAVALNGPAWSYLFASRLAPAPPAAATVLSTGLDLWSKLFERVLFLPLPYLLLFAAAGVGALRRDTRPLALRVLLLGLVVLPAVFVLIRSESGYGFRTRYFLPFFGYGLVLVAAAFDAVASLAHDLARRHRDRLAALGRRLPGRAHGLPLAAAAPAVLVALVWLAPLSALAGLPAAIARDLPALAWPPANFSPYYHAYAALVELDRPFFLFNTRLNTNDRPLLYFRHLGLTPTRPYRVADVQAADPPREETLEELRRFLREHEDALVVLDQIEHPCPGFGRAEAVAGLPVIRLGRCVLAVENVRQLGELAAVAHRLGFRARPSYFGPPGA